MDVRSTKRSGKRSTSAINYSFSAKTSIPNARLFYDRDHRRDALSRSVQRHARPLVSLCGPGPDCRRCLSAGDPLPPEFTLLQRQLGGRMSFLQKLATLFTPATPSSSPQISVVPATYTEELAAAVDRQEETIPE